MELAESGKMRSHEPPRISRSFMRATKAELFEVPLIPLCVKNDNHSAGRAWRTQRWFGFICDRVCRVIVLRPSFTAVAVLIRDIRMFKRCK